MKPDRNDRMPDRTVIIGGGMAGLAAATSLASEGEEVLLVEARSYPGGKMREISSPLGGIDSGPTVFTMKYVFEALFAKAGQTLEGHVTLEKADILARHAWDDQGHFDLHASREQTKDEIGTFFGAADAAGYEAFCDEAQAIYETLKDTFIGASRPSPIELGRRVGLTNVSALLRLQPFTTLMSAMAKFFPDPRLQQLFGRYATYVGSSPYQAPGTLMLIAHVEQEGVWLVKGGMHKLARAMAGLAEAQGAELRFNTEVTNIMTSSGRACGVVTETGELIPAKRVLYCGDVSRLTRDYLDLRKGRPKAVKPEERSLSAMTFSMEAETSGFPLHRHSVFFSNDYREEFESIFERGSIPVRPTVYVCAQDRNDNTETTSPQKERLMCLINSPANGDMNRLSERDLDQCQNNMTKILNQRGLQIKPLSLTITQAADFENLFPGSGGALYGRASHGWMASFARPGSKTKIPGLYLAGGSVHPGAGVPMATLSGMLASEQIIRDHALT